MVVIYHNPRCSKSRQTLAMLQEQGVEPTIKEYLKDAPSEQELRDVHAKLGGEAMAMVRPKEAEFAEQGLTRGASDDAIFAAIVAAPKLLERPIVVNGDKAAIGRPPESVLEIL